MYKELDLSTAEKKFVDTYANKMETFNQILDNGTSNDRSRYVAYIQSNGNATLNVANIYKDIKTIQKATGLSRSQVLTLKDIASKMVKNYNMAVNSTMNISKSNQKISASELFNGNSEVEVKYTFQIANRGIEYILNIDTIKNNSIIKSAGCYYNRYVYNFSRQWWGTTNSFNINKCAANEMSYALATSNNSFAVITNILCVAISALGTIATGVVCAVIVNTILWYSTQNLNMLNRYIGGCIGDIRFTVNNYFWGSASHPHNWHCK